MRYPRTLQHGVAPGAITPCERALSDTMLEGFVSMRESHERERDRRSTRLAVGGLPPLRQWLCKRPGAPSNGRGEGEGRLPRTQAGSPRCLNLRRALRSAGTERCLASPLAPKSQEALRNCPYGGVTSPRGLGVCPSGGRSDTGSGPSVVGFSPFTRLTCRDRTPCVVSRMGLAHAVAPTMRPTVAEDIGKCVIAGGRQAPTKPRSTEPLVGSLEVPRFHPPAHPRPRRQVSGLRALVQR